MPRAAVLAAVLVAMLTLSACGGSSFTPPQRDAAIRAEEVRTAALVERAERDGFSTVPGACRVRVLGIDGAASFVWADCTWSGPPTSGVSAPYRIDGGKVTLPGQGSGYSASIKANFPADIAAAILDDDAGLRPTRTG
jgi:hypothetical protein